MLMFLGRQLALDKHIQLEKLTKIVRGLSKHSLNFPSLRKSHIDSAVFTFRNYGCDLFNFVVYPGVPFAHSSIGGYYSVDWTRIFLVFTHSEVNFVSYVFANQRPLAHCKLILNAEWVLVVIVVYIMVSMLVLPNIHHFLEKNTVTSLIALLYS